MPTTDLKPLAILCPSRERPELCKRMVWSALVNSTAHILIYNDDDDVSNYDIPEHPRVTIMTGPPVGRGKAINHLCRFHPEFRMYLVVSDDITFVRNDWEQQVIEAMDSFGDDIGLVHLESENHEKYANWAIVSRKWVDTLGWFNEPTLRFFCQDTVLQILAEALGRIIFIQPPVIQHDVTNHPNMLARLAKDTEAFLWYCARDFGNDLNKLREAIRQASATSLTV